MLNNFYNWLLLHLILLFQLLSSTSSAQQKAVPDFDPDYEEAISYLISIKTTGEVADIQKEISFGRDVGKFLLNEGEIFLCTNFKDKVHALFFKGSGEFSFTPPTQIEKDQLYRFFDTRSYKTKFIRLFLLFDDDTFDELSKQLVIKKTNTKEIDKEVNDCLKYLKEREIAYSRSDFLRSALTKSRTGFFYAHIKPLGDTPLFFQINPFAFEEVSLMNAGELICQFNSDSQSLAKYYTEKPQKYFLKLISYKIESTIKDNLDFSAKCIIDFSSKEESQQWITFYLFEDLEVDSVINEAGHPIPFTRIKTNDELWIKCSGNDLDGETHYFTIYYHGDLLDKNIYGLGWIFIKSSIFWYPRYDNNAKAAFGLIFNYPAEYDLISIGELARSIENNDIKTSTWLCNNPIRNASFNIGKFEKFEIHEEGVPLINVYISKYGHNQMSRWFANMGIHSMSDATEYVGHDVANSFKLFEQLFGPPLVNSVAVTESPYLHGEAFPGLIHLSWATVVQTNFKGEDEIFRAHEVAHQWWPISVDFESYHDQWLSEGFSDYCGLLYLQAAKNNNEMFFEVLNSWKEQILSIRKYIFGSGTEAGPIWLGYRTQSSKTSGDYNLIIYKKGAWVLHMLRGMLLDLNTMKEDKMKNMMREFFAKFKNKFATTKDFQMLVSRHFGEDMGWFFDQYVYGTEIPLYKVAHKLEKTSDGKNIISVRVKQEDVPENFKMYVPIKLVLDDERAGRFRIEVKGKETIFKTPPIEGDLDELIFNDLESVLCTVEYESW